MSKILNSALQNINYSNFTEIHELISK